MTTPWAFDSAPPSGPPGAAAVTLVEGSSFCISDAAGGINSEHPQGLFVGDTRIVSRWNLRIDGLPPVPLTVQQDEPFSASFFAYVVPATDSADSRALIIRRRYLGNGMREDVTVRNLHGTELHLSLSLEVEVDLADLFEVKDGRAGHGTVPTLRVSGGDLHVSRERQGRHFGAIIRVHGHQLQATQEGAVWTVDVPPHGSSTTTIEVLAVVDGEERGQHHLPGEPVEQALPARNLAAWRRGSSAIVSGNDRLMSVVRRSVDDLGALRIFDPDHPQRPVVAAGAPWFMALFGRDSLLTSWMVLLLDSSLALGTLQTLASYQGHAFDPASEEEPGRILHETRFGPAATLALGGRNVYYGTADATALFVMLIGELIRWGRHVDEALALAPHAERALHWLERHGDADGDGFVEYSRKTGQGLVNQGWKDSWDGINFADGRLAEAPIALAEVQAYTYAAYISGAELAHRLGQAASARHWRARADQLKRAFNERFWLPDRGWYAVGLDRDKQPIDALTSNMGHCLWTGIVDEDKAQAVADHLLSPDMFTGWGVRTLAASMGAYNPLSYHNGSVWPHDNAICVAGLMRYGFIAHAHALAEGLLDAAVHFDHRLPELFSGLSRAEFAHPVPYPTSCSPQAWAAAAPLLLVRSLLRLEPRLDAGRVGCAPIVPHELLPLTVDGLRIGHHEVTLRVDADDWLLTGLENSGLEIISRPGLPR